MQEIIVAIIVICAAFAVIKRYAPRAAKQAFRSQSARIASRLGWHRFAAKIAERAEEGASCGNGCGSCGSCGNAPEQSQTSSAATNSTSISVEALKRTLPR